MIEAEIEMILSNVANTSSLYKLWKKKSLISNFVNKE